MTAVCRRVRPQIEATVGLGLASDLPKGRPPTACVRLKPRLSAPLISVKNALADPENWIGRRSGPSDFSNFLVDGGQHRLHVADHGIVGLAHDWRRGVGVDGQDVFGSPAADHVLDRAADATGDI